MSIHLTKLTVIASIALIIGSAQTIAAAPHGFSFRDAEYGDKAKRDARAQAFVNNAMAPGTSLSSAIAAARAAGARCAKSSGSSVLCTANFMQHVSGEGMSDVQWRIRLMTDSRGQTVTRASVRRTVD